MTEQNTRCDTAALRRLIRMHFEAKVGHLGGNLSCIQALLQILPRLGAHDRCVLSKGHSAGALYVALSRLGVIPDDELSTFHKDGTRLPGHPPVGRFEEIPFATGSLGHGLSLAAGFALSQKMRGRGGRVFCVTSDGEWQEGSTWEALIFACHHRLTNLTILVDHNGLQGFGSTDSVASMDPLWERLSGFPLATTVVDGHDSGAIDAALRESTPGGLRVIFLKTVKGNGLAAVAGTMESHYLPPTEEQYRQAIARLADA